MSSDKLLEFAKQKKIGTNLVFNIRRAEYPDIADAVEAEMVARGWTVTQTLAALVRAGIASVTKP